MRWVCPHDRWPLAADAGGLRCPECARRYPMEAGAPIFAGARKPTSPLLDELWRLVEEHGWSDAARMFSARHGCAADARPADWRFFLDASAGQTVLELGSGAGDDTLALARSGARVLVLVPDPHHARILDRRLRDEPSRLEVQVALVENLRRLPLADGSVDAVAFEDIAAAGFGLRGGKLDAAAAEWCRVLASGGVLALGLSNRLHRNPAVAGLRGRLARPRPQTLNRRLKRTGAASVPAGIGLGAVVATLARHAFDEPRLYAPLPDERRTQAVLPADSPGPVGYYLGNMVRRNSRASRAALPLARLLNRMRLLSPLLPYHYLVTTRAPRD